MNALVLYESTHRGNTAKVAREIARVLEADLVRIPDFGAPETLTAYDVIGFGSGIYGFRHHKDLIEMVRMLPDISGTQCFIFSTSGGGERNMERTHRALREQLTSKGFSIMGEFACRGMNTWGPFKLVGGTAKGRPNAHDLNRAYDFARRIKGSVRTFS